MKLAIIPARGGSKRIPNKNIRDFVGKPLVAYSIEVAKASGLFDKIVVTTDNQEVADIALEYGAEVPFIRPPELSNDVIGTRPVTNHAIRYVSEHFEKPEFCCCIYATAPFLQAEYLKQGLQKLRLNSDKGFAYSVTSFPFPIQRALFLKDNYATPSFPEDITKRSQDLEEAYHDAGQFYWGRTDDYLSSKRIFSEHGIPIVLPRHLVQDIDTQEDWDRAELMYKAYVLDQTAKTVAMHDVA
ncbi:pseudaminic acid cytidylyltransferase [Glaciecola sp. MF2-115]|uniref:pseudaminic acid cytidylyltransferase n=1 Tax=Glaciecola sp. MF2-115 TaxID=3384827 RepID=UPI00399F1797